MPPPPLLGGRARRGVIAVLLYLHVPINAIGSTQKIHLDVGVDASSTQRYMHARYLLRDEGPYKFLLHPSLGGARGEALLRYFCNCTFP